MAKTSLSGAMDVFKKDNVIKVAATLGGIVIGNFASDKIRGIINSNSGGGDWSGWLVPLAVMAGGYTLGRSIGSPVGRAVGLGAVISGGTGLINKIMGRSVVSLGAAEEDPYPYSGPIPGVGAIELPDNQAAMTQYSATEELLNPAAEVAGASEETAGANEYPALPAEEGVGSDLDPVNLNGVEEANI